MSMLVEPGTRLAGRYRLEERVSETDDSTLWKAIDEPLARPVAVRTFTQESPRAGAVIAAARAASRVPDSRLAQVFDADESAAQPYLVCEWVEGDRLLDVLTRGQLEPWRAVRFLTEATGAIVAAHAAGLAHLRLDPSSLIWARGGTVKITGLAIDAALQGHKIDDHAPATDVRALGALLYAALTAHWPVGSGRPAGTEVGLPHAPLSDDGGPVPVSEYRHDLPGALEDITARALGQRPAKDEPAFESPAELREALAGLPRLAPLPPQAQLPQFTNRAEGSSVGAATGSAVGAEPEQAGAMAPPARRGSRPVRALLLTAVGALVLVASALGAWQIGRALDDSQGGNSGPAPRPDGNAAPTKAPVLSIANIHDYDPENLGGDGKAHPDEIGHVTDGAADTFWTTQTYKGQFGPDGLKPGVGLMLDMGKPTPVSKVQVTVGSQATSLALYAGDQPDRGEMQKVDTVTSASGQTALEPQQPARARYLLVYITELPQVSDGYQGRIAEIVAHGAP